MKAPSDTAGALCSACGGELRPTSITADGASYSCPCGRTSWTMSAKGKLDFGIVRDSKLTDPEDGPEHRGDDLCRFDWPEEP